MYRPTVVNIYYSSNDTWNRITRLNLAFFFSRNLVFNNSRFLCIFLECIVIFYSYLTCIILRVFSCVLLKCFTCILHVYCVFLNLTCVLLCLTACASLLYCCFVINLFLSRAVPSTTRCVVY